MPDAAARQQVLGLEDDVARFRDAVICALTQLLDLRDLATGVHSTDLVEMALEVGERMRMHSAELSDLEMAATLHDIGKIGIRDHILTKSGPLTEEERLAMNKHPEFSWAILRLFPGFANASLIVLHHHERYDGEGYPGRLRGEQIPLGSRILAVVDAFAAMTTSRPYRAGLPAEEAFRRLREDAGKQFDPAVVEHFISARMSR